jgi:hypothetical protein
VAATLSDDQPRVLLKELLGQVAGCCPRRESRQAASQMAAGLLMELEDYNCWSIAEAVGHRGPHRLQHLLSRAAWDDQRVLDAAAAWAMAQLDDGAAVLVVDETADEKSSADAVGAARQYSGTVGGVALCQVAVTLTFATSRGHTLIDRALYLPEGWAADEEHRDLAGVPEEVMFATKPELASALLQKARQRGIGAAFVTGDEVYGGRDLRRAIRPGHGIRAGSSGQPHPHPRLRPHPDRGRSRQADPPRRLAADAHRARHQGKPPPRLGDAGGDQRRRAQRPARQPGCRAQRAAGPPPPLHRHLLVLPDRYRWPG